MDVILKMKRKIILHGAFRGDNFGDTLLLKLAVGEVLKIGGVPVISNTCKTTMQQMPSGCLTLGKDVRVRSCDGLIYCGGGYFGEQPKNAFKWNLRFLKLHVPVGLMCMLLRKPIAVIGVGAGPLQLRINRFFVKKLSTVASALWVRDVESKDFLVSIGVAENLVNQCADLALSLNFREFEGKRLWPDGQTAEDVVALHLSSPSLTDSNQNEVFEGVLSFAKAHPEKLFIAICDSHGNAQKAAAAELSSRIGPDRCVQVDYEGVEKLLEVIASCGLVITNKLHIGIVAAAFSIPSVSIANHPKTLRLYRQLGREAFCLLKQGVARGSVSEILEAAIFDEGLDRERLNDLKVRSRDGLQAISSFIQNL